MIKLSKLIQEIKIMGKINPKDDLELFLKMYYNQIRRIIPNFDLYIDPNKSWEFSYEEYEEFPDYVVIGNKNNCLGIGFTADVENELEGDGPISNGEIIEINGFSIQYQKLAC